MEGGYTGDVILNSTLTISDAAVSTLSDIQSAVNTSIESLSGDELTGSWTNSLGTLTILGFAFYSPVDPYTPPAAPVTPPDNLYGCQNNITLTLTPAAESITFTFTAPQVYIDLETNNADGYILLTNFTDTVTASLLTLPDGRKQIANVTGGSVSYESIIFHSKNAFIDFLGSTFISSFAGLLNNDINTFFDDFVSKIIPGLPPYEP